MFSDLPYAVSVEYGMPARDLKKMLDTSLKVRLAGMVNFRDPDSKTGSRQSHFVSFRKMVEGGRG